MTTEMTDDPLRTGMRKCARRKPGENVTLTDDEVRALLTDQYRGGQEEVISQVNTAMVRRLQAEVATLKGQLAAHTREVSDAVPASDLARALNVAMGRAPHSQDGIRAAAVVERALKAGPAALRKRLKDRMGGTNPIIDGMVRAAYEHALEDVEAAQEKALKGEP